MKQFKKSFNKKILNIKILLRENFPNLYKFLCFIWKQKVKPIFWLTFNKPKGTLVYIGLNKGDSFAAIHYKFKLAIGYEANPDLYKELVKKYHPDLNKSFLNKDSKIKEINNAYNFLLKLVKDRHEIK